MFGAAAPSTQTHPTSPGGLLEQPGAHYDHAGKDNIRNIEAVPR